jgi:hypothetical protein
MHYLKRVKESYAYDDLLAYFGCVVLVEEEVVLDELK